MKPESFAYWLQGFVELCGKQPTPKQWEQIKDHLKEVFTKITPDRDPLKEIKTVPGTKAVPFKIPDDWHPEPVNPWPRPKKPFSDEAYCYGSGQPIC